MWNPYPQYLSGRQQGNSLKWPSAIHVLPRQMCVPHRVNVSFGSAGTRCHRHFTHALWMLGEEGMSWEGLVPFVTQQDILKWGMVERLQCHRAGTMTPVAQMLGRAYKAILIPAYSHRNHHSIDWCPHDSLDADGLTISVLEFSIFTGARGRGSKGVSSVEG